jgi:Fe-S oxidoreductase
MKTHAATKVVRALTGQAVDINDRCCGESGTLAVTRPDVSTQVRFRKQQEIELGIEHLKLSHGDAPRKILTSCPSCLQGLWRYADDTNIDADYIVVEMANRLLGEDWQRQYIAAASAGGIERVLL